MNKKMLALALAMAFSVSIVAVGFAGTVKCKVTAVDGSKVTMDCGSDAGKLKVDSEVKVKAAGKGAVEGC